MLMGSSSLAWVIDQWVGSCVMGHHMGGSFAPVESQKWGHPFSAKPFFHWSLLWLSGAGLLYILENIWKMDPFEKAFRPIFQLCQ